MKTRLSALGDLAPALAALALALAIIVSGMLVGMLVPPVKAGGGVSIDPDIIRRDR